ncbi:MAG: PD-(D/E)XK motif protein [Aestuariivita sp.]|nr:PD-(D/E)XK motif protein [Aestuariivita sp.]
MSDSHDPWAKLKIPDQTTKVSGRRVDPGLQWSLYWAIDTDKSCLLILQHAPSLRPKGRLPNLRGLEIEIRTPEEGNHALLVIRLKDNGQRDIFYRLCVDIVAATRAAQSEKEAVEQFLARTWRWHRLLRGGRNERLSDEEQKGLIGELRLMQEHLFSAVGMEACIKSWSGPLGTPKDFEIGRVCIEAKTRRGAATPFVSISSEHQLETSGIDTLFLVVSELTGASSDDTKGLSVSDVARSVLANLQENDASVVELFEQRLLAAGFEWNHDYSDNKWLVGTEHVFEITENFPRIVPDMYPSGASNVRYSIALKDCESFRVDQARLNSALKGGTIDDQH